MPEIINAENESLLALLLTLYHSFTKEFTSKADSLGALLLPAFHSLKIRGGAQYHWDI
jgi:hypothetical protein